MRVSVRALYVGTAMTDTREELARKVRELQKEVARLHAQLKEKRFGLTWIDVPEAFEQESENKIPVLEEVPELAVHNDDGKPTHVLIEGDNYHALTCLNYTHRGKVDVIYIDPPYNTGNDGFTYKDKRFLEEYPDGTPIKIIHPLRHSAWLSFMSRRLKLAKELLSDNGVIFISIDDNEHAHLKMICDNVFGVDNFITSLPRKGTGGRQDSKYYAIVHEYILVYAQNLKYFEAGREEKSDVGYNLYDEQKGLYYKTQLLRKWGDNSRREDRPNLYYPIYFDVLTFNFYVERHNESDLEIYPMLDNNREGCWRWGKTTMKKAFKENRVELKKNRNGKYEAYERKYKKADDVQTKPFSTWIDDIDNSTGATLLNDILGNDVFSYPKPVDLVFRLLKMGTNLQSAIILDFFAGSGTTLHATMQLNEEDGGKRQCILCQLNEADICRNVTYERNRRVMEGYTDSNGNDVSGLGNSLKYYSTAFVGKNQPKAATDDDKLTLSKKAGCLLGLAENTLYETETTDYYQIYTDEKGHWTCIYFQEDYSRFEEFRQKVVDLEGVEKSVYVFCWTDGAEFAAEFEYETNVTVKSIPQPILDIYKSLNA